MVGPLNIRVEANAEAELLQPLPAGSLRVETVRGENVIENLLTREPAASV
jgi:hypothetical protein